MMLSACVYGQEIVVETLAPPSVQVEEILINAQLPDLEENKIHKIESRPLTDFVNSLNTRSGAFIKSYGTGSVATISLWGGNSNHTLITWEDIPITNPMLGLTDLSLMTLWEDQNIQLEKGGLSAIHGSGAVTGKINLGQTIEQNKSGIHGNLSFSMGSWDRELTQLSVGHAGEKFNISTTAFYNRSENNFEYKLGNDIRINPNADLDSKGLQLHSDYKINDHQIIEVDAWVQETERGVPPTTTQSASSARQYDLTKRVRLGWEGSINNLQTEVAFAYLDEHNDFTDPAQAIDAANRFKRYWSNANISFPKNQMSFLFKYQLSKTIGISKNYLDGQQNLDLLALYAGYNYRWKGMTFSGGLRKEWNSRTDVPFMPTFSISAKFFSWDITTKLTKEFRVPTLNETFWTPGGNPSLKPENGWNEELWMTNENIAGTGVRITSTLFHRLMDNWILWAPQDGSFFWSAGNIGKVRSYGLDLQADKNIELLRLDILFSMGYNYVRSSYQTAFTIPVIEVGDQLPYTPKHKFFAHVQPSYRSFELSLDASYTGSSKGINEDVEPFFLLDMFLIKNFKEGSYAGSISLGIQNLTNSTYRIIERRPMPGLNFLLGCSMSFGNKKIY